MNIEVHRFWVTILREQSKKAGRPVTKDEVCFIRKAFWHKEYVMLLSVVPTMTGTSAMWSAHYWGEAPGAPIDVLRTMFQKSHNEQIDKMIWEEFLNEPEQYRKKTVDDQTNLNDPTR